MYLVAASTITPTHPADAGPTISPLPTSTPVGDETHTALCQDEHAHETVTDAAVVAVTPDRRLSPFDVLLDSQATISLVQNPTMLTDIREAPKPLQVQGIGGGLIVSKIGTLPHFGDVYHHEEASANVLSLSQAMERGADIAFAAESNEFVWRSADMEFVFKPKNGLYACNWKDLPTLLPPEPAEFDPRGEDDDPPWDGRGDNPRMHDRDHGPPAEATG